MFLSGDTPRIGRSKIGHQLCQNLDLFQTLRERLDTRETKTLDFLVRDRVVPTILVSRIVVSVNLKLREQPDNLINDLTFGEVKLLIPDIVNLGSLDFFIGPPPINDMLVSPSHVSD